MMKLSIGDLITHIPTEWHCGFDNDGALDMVINNINDEALLYRIRHVIKTAV
jgi:hypothetical protein